MEILGLSPIISICTKRDIMVGGVYGIIKQQSMWIDANCPINISELAPIQCYQFWLIEYERIHIYCPEVIRLPSEYIQNILLQLMLEYSIEITEQYDINRLRIAINFGCQWKRLCFHYKLAWNFPINFNSWFMVLKLAKNQLLLTPLFCWMNADNTQYPRSISHGFTSHKWEEHIRLHNLMVVRKAARCRWLFHQ